LYFNYSESIKRENIATINLNNMKPMYGQALVVHSSKLFL